MTTSAKTVSNLPNSDHSGATVQQYSNRARWQIFAVSVAASALSILDISKINVALPSLEHNLDAGPGLLQFLVAGYTLALGLTLVPSGRFGDISSRRNMFLIGVGLFLASSMLCALSPDINILVAGRLVQGVAAGILMPQVLGIIQQLFQGKERGMALGAFGAIIGLSTAFGPALGGLLLAMGDPVEAWRYIFWMNVPIAAVIIAFGFFLLPKIQPKAQVRLEMDMLGTLFLALAIFSLMVPFVLTTGRPTDDPSRWFWMIGFGVFAALFVLWEMNYARRGKAPVINFNLFKHASFRNGTLIGFFYFGAMPPLFLLATLFLQNGVGLSPIEAGLVGIPFALASAVTSWYGGKYVFSVGRKLVIYGLLLVAVGLALILLAAYFVEPAYVLWAMMVGMLIGGTGSGLVISPNQTLQLEDIPIMEGGLAGSIGQVGQRVGTAIGVALTVSLFYATITLPKGEVANLGHYHQAMLYSFGILLGFLILALFFSVWDSRTGRKSASKQPAA